MQIGCGNGLGLGLVSLKLLASEQTLGYGESYRACLFFLLFFSFLSLFPWVTLDACGFSSLGYTAFVWIPFVFSLSETETRPSRLHWQSYIKKHLQLYLSLSLSIPVFLSAGIKKARPHPHNARNAPSAASSSSIT
jgi:hypothetical protein